MSVSLYVRPTAQLPPPFGGCTGADQYLVGSTCYTVTPSSPDTIVVKLPANPPQDLSRIRHMIGIEALAIVLLGVCVLLLNSRINRLSR